MKILVTGGAGYIGGHIVVELLNDSHSVTIVDNLSNSSIEAVKRVEKITNKKIDFYNFDLRDRKKLDTLFEEKSFDTVVHCAGLKSVRESTENPLLYYRVNIDSTLSLLESMQKYNVNKLVFSSSATVYGSSPIPYDENSIAGRDLASPYAQTKYFIEQIIRDVAASNPKMGFTILRYFNPIGAHESGLIGEHTSGVPNNLMPYLLQVASKKRESLSIFGDDYETPDGTAIRDYIHVVDLAKGHLAALKNIKDGVRVYNLGSGKGVSVLELVNAFIEATNLDVPYTIEERRAGDLPAYYAHTDKAAQELDWKTNKSIYDMCLDAWNWQDRNPNGYDT
jgi:UDP-glucose 4-epimerase